MRVWRICKSAYRESSFSGNGALSVSGRWHHKGNRIVYTAGSLSLAQLEVWVHEDPLPDRLKTYISVSAEVPDDLDIRIIADSELTANWRASDPSPSVLKDIGTEWLQSLSTAVARVPSAIVSGEFNYLLNPAHRDFGRIMQNEPEPFDFDRRMWKRHFRTP